MEYGLKSKKQFSRDDFLNMISLTYNEYYGKFRD